MDTFPPRQRHVVVGCFLHGRSNADLSRELGVSESAVSVVVARVLKRLAQDFYLRDWLVA